MITYAKRKVDTTDPKVKDTDVLVIGVGFSGVCAGIKLLEKGITNFRIYNKSSGIGGTWWNNTYPGAVCDVPSHLYCYSFEPNHNWSRIYPAQGEIKTYIEHCVTKYGLTAHIRHGEKIVKLMFDEITGLWNVIFEDGNIVKARHVINGSGGLHVPHIPNFPGHKIFEGAGMHTARWDHSVNMYGKRIAVIGSAASAIQVVPEMAKIGKEVFVFQRTPNYVAPRKDREYTTVEKIIFSKVPFLARLYRWFIFMRMELLLFPVTKKNSPRGNKVGNLIKQYMRATVNDKNIHASLEPDYKLGCKRILISDDYYKTLNRENVSLVTDEIQEIKQNGILTKTGQLFEVDAIIYATGFDIEKHLRSVEVIGPNKKSLLETWAVNQDAYQGACIAGFPNFYIVTGPNTGVATTSVVFMIEQQIHFIMQLIKRAGQEKLISVKEEAQDRYNDVIHSALKDTVWSSGCKSWYIREDGRITTLYPYNGRAFRKQSKKVNFNDFTVV
jgi:cation diffusion facilitator CzcD-associated flavoprotein CzcO